MFHGSTCRVSHFFTMDNWREKCRNHKCKVKACMSCTGCKIVSYCSNECQKEDYPLHKQLCYASFNERLVAVCHFAKKYDTLNDGFNLSTRHCADVHPNSVYFFGAFSGTFTSYRCAICVKQIDYAGPYDHIKGTVYFEGTWLKYYRCVKCNNEKKSLCGGSLMETTLCEETRRKKFVHTFFLCKELLVLSLHPDLIQPIIHSLLSLLSCTLSCK